MHIKSLETYAFDSILVPYSFVMMNNPEYAADFDALYELCSQRGVAMQTIKSIAARRWKDDDPERRLSWYRPLRDSGAIQRAVDFVLTRPGSVFEYQQRRDVIGTAATGRGGAAPAGGCASATERSGRAGHRTAICARRQR